MTNITSNEGQQKQQKVLHLQKSQSYFHCFNRKVLSFAIFSLIAAINRPVFMSRWNCFSDLQFSLPVSSGESPSSSSLKDSQELVSCPLCEAEWGGFFHRSEDQEFEFLWELSEDILFTLTSSVYGLRRLCFRVKVRLGVRVVIKHIIVMGKVRVRGKAMLLKKCKKCANMQIKGPN